MRFTTGHHAVAGEGGWVQFLGFGIHWKPREARAYFSERNGYIRFYKLGPIRFSFFTPWGR